MPIVCRTCRTCKRMKLISEFYPHKRQKSGFDTECKECNLVRVKRNVERRKRSTPTTPDNGFKTCKKCGVRKKRSEFNISRNYKDHRNPLCRECYNSTQRPRWMKTKYDISQEDYEALLHAQGGVCAICRQPEAHTRHGRVLPLCVDHCHVSGKRRKLLCSRCNRALGLFKDDADILRAAAEYLDQFRDALE